MFPTQAVGPYQVPLFPQITSGAWEQALRQALDEAHHEVVAIATDDNPPTFDNTFLALERVLQKLDKTVCLFSAVKLPHATPALSEIAKEWLPRVSVFMTELYQDAGLYQRCQSAAASPGPANEAQARLIADHQRSFRDAGLALEPLERQRLRDIGAEISLLGERFTDACRDAAAAVVVLGPHAEKGLSPDEAARARETARSQGRPGGLGFALDREAVDGLLAKMEDRHSRRRLYLACANRGHAQDGVDTTPLIQAMLALRQERAALLGFASPADHFIDNTMAGHPDRALELVMSTWKQMRPALRREIDQLQTLASQDGVEDLSPWDVPYYTEQWRRQHYQIDGDLVSAHLPLPAVREGAFRAASELFGIAFEPVQAQWYHPDVQVYLVKEAGDGAPLGLLSIDDTIRDTKPSDSAWMDNLRAPSGLDGPQHPWVVNACNFEASVPGAPPLLSLEQASTVFHELGHALHALLSTAQYPSQAGTNVKQDFVELPSQIMENWAVEPESLCRFARHWQTGAPLPLALAQRMVEARQFGQGIELARYLTSAYLDLALHGQPSTRGVDLSEFERSALNQLDAPNAIAPRHRLHHFSHLFSGDEYAANYYCYLWAEVLEAGAFARFRTEGLFNPATGAALRSTIFAPGDSRDPASLFRDFTGHDPDPSALLDKRGLSPPPPPTLGARPSAKAKATP